MYISKRKIKSQVDKYFRKTSQQLAFKLLCREHEI